MSKPEANIEVYLFRTGPIAGNEKDSVCASYVSDQRVPRGAGPIGSIDSKVDGMADDIFRTLRIALGKYHAKVTTYNGLDSRMQAVEDSNPTRTILPKELYTNLTNALKKKCYGLIIK